MGYKIKKVRIWVNNEEKQIYPAFELKKIFDFTTADLHGFTQHTSGGSGLVIDTTNHWCTRGNSNWSNGGFYKDVNYSRCWQRIKGNFNYASGTGGMFVGTADSLAVSGWAGLALGIADRSYVRIYTTQGTASYTNYSLPSGWSVNTDYYYDMIFDNGNMTYKIYDTSMNEIFSLNLTVPYSTIERIGFGMYSGTTSQGAAYIKEYRLAYQE